VIGHPAARVNAELPAHRRGPLPSDAGSNQTEDAVLCMRPGHLAAISLHCVAVPHLHHLPRPRGEYLHATFLLINWNTPLPQERTVGDEEDRIIIHQTRQIFCPWKFKTNYDVF
jgi:hypothetical protein